MTPTPTRPADEPVPDAAAEEPRPTPEQTAGRPLVDLKVDELREVAAEFEVEGRSSMKREALLEALGARPDDLTESEREDAARAAVEAENAAAPAEDADPLALMPWERHDDVEPPLTPQELADNVREAAGLELLHTASDGMVRTWGDAEAVAEDRAREQ